MPFEHLAADHRAIDIALRVHADAFSAGFKAVIYVDQKAPSPTVRRTLSGFAPVLTRITAVNLGSR